MSSSSKVVLCTSANQGLGFAVLQVAGLREPSYIYILCSRNLDAGKQAVQRLRDLGVTAKVDLLQLDVTDAEQIAAAVRHVEAAYGRLDGEMLPPRFPCRHRSLPGSPDQQRRHHPSSARM